MTMIRSASAVTSSSSVETTTTGTPSSRVSMMRLWMNSIDPTSTPRVGCAATRRRRSRLSSRARTTFCWLPPERRPAQVSIPGVRMSNSWTLSFANSARNPRCTLPAFTNGAPSARSSMRFSAMENSPTRPSSLRSSGTKPTPASRMRRTEFLVMSSPSSRMVPCTRGCSPTSASVSSVWPLPWTPATASTSPRRTLKLTSLTTSWPIGSTTLRCSTVSASSPSFGSSLWTVSSTARPTMREASSALEAVGAASPTTLPRRMTVMRSATSRTSRSLCVMKTMDAPDSLSWRMMPMSSSVSCGVSTAVGSSKTRTRASRESALMISTRCWTPTGRSSTSASGSTSKPNRSLISRTFARAACRSSTPAPLVCSCPSMTFSATVKTGMSMKCWCTMPMPARIASPGPANCCTWPSSRISPSSAW